MEMETAWPSHRAPRMPRTSVRRARGAQRAIDVVYNQRLGVRGHEPRKDLEQVLQAGLGVSDHQAGQGNEEDEKREEEQQEEVGELAGEPEQIVASHPEHHFPKHPGAEDAFQVRVELSHGCVGYPARWVRTIQVRESGLLRIPQRVEKRASLGSAGISSELAWLPVPRITLLRTRAN